MTDFLQLTDNARTVALFGSLDNITDPVTFLCTAGDGAKFPSSGVVTVWDAGTKPNPGDDISMEQMAFTRSGDSFTVTRGYGLTTPHSHPGTPAVRLLILAKHFQDIHTAIGTIEGGGSSGNWQRMASTMGDGTAGPYPLGFTPIAGALFNVTLDGIGGLIAPTDYTVTGTDITFSGVIATTEQIDVWQ